jgi:hypothetical protein
VEKSSTEGMSVYLDADADVRLDDDPDEGLSLVLFDDGGEVVIPLAPGPEAWHAVRRLGLKILATAPDVKAANLRFKLGEPVNTHGPATGPGGWT